MENNERSYGTGRRKCAVARVWVKPGTGKVLVNHKDYKDYFVRETSRMISMQAIELVEMADKLDVYATVKGGGLSGQAEAVRHAITRALCRFNIEYRTPLKRAGYVTRDPRVVERKKYGQKGARARFQFSKR
ncbi:30S ribosomal protein S9 [Myxococcota bacterium]|nr:30S ribosomal protein S9 [Myxococcota bacterium]MBU1536816.1 30S ribosomal protein S9 [Myxococcota bacterium]